MEAGPTLGLKTSIWRSCQRWLLLAPRALNSSVYVVSLVFVIVMTSETESPGLAFERVRTQPGGALSI